MFHGKESEEEGEQEQKEWALVEGEGYEEFEEGALGILLGYEKPLGGASPEGVAK